MLVVRKIMKKHHMSWEWTGFIRAMEESEILPRLLVLVIGKIKMVVPVIGTVNSGKEKLLKINEFEVPKER